MQGILNSFLYNHRIKRSDDIIRDSHVICFTHRINRFFLLSLPSVMTGFPVSFLFSSVFLHPARATAKIPTSRIPAITLFPFIFLPSLLFSSTFFTSDFRLFITIQWPALRCPPHIRLNFLYDQKKAPCKKTHRNSIHNTHLTLTLYSYTFDYSIQNIPCP